MTRNLKPIHQARTAALVAAATASLMLIACGQHELGVGDNGDTAVSRVAEAVAPAPLSAQQLEAKSREAQADAAITAGIKAEFANDAALSGLHIQVQTQEGLVVLTGKAPDAAAREHATRVAVTIKDVLSVDNKMVLPAT